MQMLRKLKALPYLMKPHNNVYSMSQINHAAIKKLSGVLDNELADIEKLKQDEAILRAEQDFKSSDWKVSYNDIQIQLSKIMEPYEINVLFNARPPLSFPNEQKSQEHSHNYFKPDSKLFSFGLFINRTGVSKWFELEIVMAEDTVDIAAVNFIQDFEAKKRQRFREDYLKYYQRQYGPHISKLDPKFVTILYNFINHLGFDHSFFSKSAKFSVLCSDKFYKQWLQNFQCML